MDRRNLDEMDSAFYGSLLTRFYFPFGGLSHCQCWNQAIGNTIINIKIHFNSVSVGPRLGRDHIIIHLFYKISLPSCVSVCKVQDSCSCQYNFLFTFLSFRHFPGARA